MLNNGTAPSAIMKNLESTIHLFYPNRVIKVLSNINYMQKMHCMNSIIVLLSEVHELDNNRVQKYIW